MTYGNEAVNQKYKSMITSVLEKNPDKAYLNGFLNWMGNSKTYPTKYNYLFHAAAYVSHTNKPVDQLGLDDYSAYLADMEDKSASYKVMVYSALKLFSQYLYITKKNSTNPMLDVNRPSSRESFEIINKRENNYLTEEEIPVFLATVESGRNGVRNLALVMLMLLTGIRESAVFKLNVSDVELFSVPVTQFSD